jgi:hypothetical protein
MSYSASARARDEQLQDRWRAVAQRGLGGERFRRVLIRPADSDRPLLLKLGDKAGKSRSHCPAPAASALLRTTGGSTQGAVSSAVTRLQDPAVRRL